MSKEEIRDLLDNYIDVIEHDRLYYWTYEKSLRVFNGLIKIAYENKAIDKRCYKKIVKFISDEYNERYKEVLNNERV